jgi:hypothetical protein
MLSTGQNHLKRDQDKVRAKLLCSGFPQLGDPVVQRVGDPLLEVFPLPFSL